MYSLSFKNSKKAIPIAVIKCDSDEHHSLHNRLIFLKNTPPVSHFDVVLDDKRVDIGGSGGARRDLLSAHIVKKPESEAAESAKGTLRALLNTDASKIAIPSDCRFEVLPINSRPTNNRTAALYSGTSGSGKSFSVRSMVQNYLEIFPKNGVYLISSLDKDETLDKIPEITRLDMKSIISSPIDINSGAFNDCMVIFDDYEGLPNADQKILQELIDSILTKGRHSNTSILLSTHNNTDGRKSKFNIPESEFITVFPGGTSASNMNYLLGTVVGIPREELKKIRGYGRWITFKKSYPNILFSSNVIKLI